MSEKDSQNADVILSEDHEELAELLGALQAALHEHDSSAAFTHLDLFWARLAMHIRAEHLHLFPSILRSAGPDRASRDVEKAIEQLRTDHDFFMHELSSAIKILRETKTTQGDFENHLAAVRGIIKAVSDRLELHNELEEEIVYLMPAILLTPKERVALADKIRVELENLPPRFTSGPRG